MDKNYPRYKKAYQAMVNILESNIKNPDAEEYEYESQDGMGSERDDIIETVDCILAYESDADVVVTDILDEFDEEDGWEKLSFDSLLRIAANSAIVWDEVIPGQASNLYEQIIDSKMLKTYYSFNKGYLRSKSPRILAHIMQGYANDYMFTRAKYLLYIKIKELVINNGSNIPRIWEDIINKYYSDYKELSKTLTGFSKFIDKVDGLIYGSKENRDIRLANKQILEGRDEDILHTENLLGAWIKAK